MSPSYKEHRETRNSFFPLRWWVWFRMGGGQGPPYPTVISYHIISFVECASSHLPSHSIFKFPARWSAGGHGKFHRGCISRPPHWGKQCFALWGCLTLRTIYAELWQRPVCLSFAGDFPAGIIFVRGKSHRWVFYITGVEATVSLSRDVYSRRNPVEASSWCLRLWSSIAY